MRLKAAFIHRMDLWEANETYAFHRIPACDKQRNFACIL